MIKLLFALILITISNFAFSQQRDDQTLWHLTIVDSVSARSIAGVTVTINRTKHFSTNLNGAININKTIINLKDSIRISCIGYKPLLLKPGVNFKFPDTVRLSSTVTSLKEVRVNALNREIRIGDIKKSYVWHRITSPNESLAQFIPNEKKISGIVSSIEFMLNDELHGIENPFRVRLYTKYKDSVTLDQELTTDSIIVYNPEKKRRLSVDVSRYNIQLPEEGVIVVFETLSSSYYGRDSVWHWGQKYAKTPGIDMHTTKKNQLGGDNDKIDRKGPYSMVGPEADRWNWDGVYSQWYKYADGTNFDFTITIIPN
jgi:hypothetical protein